MAVGERPTQKQQRRKTASFSSSLLDAVYHSIDEPREEGMRRNNVEDEVQSLRRAIMVEKWMQNYTKSRHNPSNSASSSDNSTTFFSSSETDSSRSKSCEGRFTRTKSKAMKIYGDLKKVKEPISPGAKIANFLNSIFSPRNLKKNNGVLEEWRKSRSMKEDKTATCPKSRSCLSKNTTNSARANKSKRSVRFCPAVSVIVDDDHAHAHHHSITNLVGSQFIKKNIDSFHDFRREFYENHDKDVDDKSCASSDLFELENIGRRYEEELPVFGTTSFKINQAIASVNLYDY